MTRGRLARLVRCLGAVAALALVACSDAPGPAEEEPAPRNEAHDSELRTLRTRIDSLRAEGRFTEALAAARTRDRFAQGSSGVRAWERTDARLEVATLARVAGLPDSARQAFARADRRSSEADSSLAAIAPVAAREAIASQLRTRRRLLDRDDPEIAVSLSALARLALDEGDLRTARDLDAEALALRQRVLGDRHPRFAESLDAVGWDAKTAGDPKAALRLCQRAARLQRELLGPDSGEEYSTLVHVANAYRVVRQPDSALVVFRQVLEHHRREIPPDLRSIERVLFGMSMTVIPEGRYAEAELWLREAVALQRQLGSPERLSLARSLAAQGSALRHLGRPREAQIALDEAVRLAEALRRDAAPGIARGGINSLAGYGMLAAAQLEGGDGASAWLSTERPLARTLVEELASKGAIDTTGWWANALPRARAALADDEALVGWLALRPGAAQEEYPFWCYCLRRNGAVHWARVEQPVGAPAAADLPLDEMRRELNRAAAWPLRMVDTAEIDRLGRLAYARRFAPLEPWLDGVRHLIVVAPDLAHGAPIAAWVDEQGRPIATRFALTYAPSALLYAQRAIEARERRDPASSRALLIADSEAGGERGRRDGLRGLAAARTEIREIASLLPSPVVLLDEDATVDRLRQLAASGELARFGLIHISAHAAVDEVWIGRSALLLASPDTAPNRGGAGTREPSADNRLAMEDIIRGWRLDADLVTLAACQSFRGPATTNDGFLGLPFALLSAGARQVLATLWPVDDRATALLMSRFYQERVERSTAGEAATSTSAAALQAASLALRDYEDASGAHPYAHPIYWASFILIDGGAASPRN